MTKVILQPSKLARISEQSRLRSRITHERVRKHKTLSVKCLMRFVLKITH